MKPPKIGTVINHEMLAKVQVINEKTMKWETIDFIIDTPKYRSEMKKKYKNKSLWLKTISDRVML